jgi:uncharacterized protein (TIGR02001 family)
LCPQAQAGIEAHRTNCGIRAGLPGNGAARLACCASMVRFGAPPRGGVLARKLHIQSPSFLILTFVETPSMQTRPILMAAAITCLLAPLTVSAQASPLSSNASLTSDYRYRGISQSRLKPALQGGADYAFASGFYIGTWASTIKWIKDTPNAGNTAVEIDLYGGYKGEIAKDFGYDVGVLQYYYPGNKLKNVGAKNANTTEIYGALTYGPATLKYSHSLTPLFGFGNATDDSEGSGYLDLSANFDVGAGVTLTPHVGRQRVAGTGFGDFSYTDFALTAAKDWVGFTWSGAIVGADVKKINGVPAYVSPTGKNLGKTSLVVAVKKVF